LTAYVFTYYVTFVARSFPGGSGFLAISTFLSAVPADFFTGVSADGVFFF